MTLTDDQRSALRAVLTAGASMYGYVGSIEISTPSARLASVDKRTLAVLALRGDAAQRVVEAARACLGEALLNPGADYETRNALRDALVVYDEEGE